MAGRLRTKPNLEEQILNALKEGFISTSDFADALGSITPQNQRLVAKY